MTNHVAEYCAQNYYPDIDMNKAIESFRNTLKIYEDKVKEINDFSKKAKEKYGEDLIRIHWNSLQAAYKCKQLKPVCCFSNGDEGFIIQDIKE